MALYLPDAFAAREPAAALRLIDDYPFATLITAVDGEEPQISHLPLLREGDALFGHVARANPHWLRFAQGRTLAVFAGPHAYVSPRAYRVPEQNVPTWNYAVVHVIGRPETLAEEDARSALETAMRRFDPGFAVAPDRLRQLLPAIVAFRIPMTRIDAKFKLSQNRNAADRTGIATALSRADEPIARELARWIRPDD